MGEAVGTSSFRDLVCGMQVQEDSPLRHEYAGQTYRFCGKSCLEKFRADPTRYLTRPEETPTRTAPSTAHPEDSHAIYTCPMHPEVRQTGPGTCPKCGMALEPLEAALVEAENPELVDMTRRFWVGVTLTVPLLVVAMGDMLPGRPIERSLGPTVSAWLQLVLASPVVLWAGWPFFVRGWQSIVNRSPNMFTLISLGVSMAFIESLLATLVPQVFPAAFRMHGGRVAAYFEAAAVIVTLVLLGQVLELREEPHQFGHSFPARLVTQDGPQAAGGWCRRGRPARSGGSR